MRKALTYKLVLLGDAGVGKVLLKEQGQPTHNTDCTGCAIRKGAVQRVHRKYNRR